MPPKRKGIVSRAWANARASNLGGIDAVDPMPLGERKLRIAIQSEPCRRQQGDENNCNRAAAHRDVARVEHETDFDPERAGQGKSRRDGDRYGDASGGDGPWAAFSQQLWKKQNVRGIRDGEHHEIPRRSALQNQWLRRSPPN